MVSRTARPRTVFPADGAPGPSAHIPEFRLAWRPFGPLTSTSGAWGPVDIALLRMYIFGSARQRTAAIRSGRCSGPQPAITALTASFSTVATPKPGSSVAITSAGLAWADRRIAATARPVGGTSRNPPDQPPAREPARI